MTSTFGSVTLPKAKITNIVYNSPFTKDETTAGRTTTQGSEQYAAEVTVECHTSSYTDVTNLLAVLGDKLTLAVGSSSFTNMKIAGRITINPQPLGDYWIYSATFQQETV